MRLRQKKFLMRCIDTESEVSVVFIYGSFDKLGLENNRVFYFSLITEKCGMIKSKY